MEPVRHGDASELGLTRSHLRQRFWTHPLDGLAMPADWTGDLHLTCRAVQLMLPSGAVFTHVSAAALRGWPLPDCLVDAPLIACTDGDAPHLDRRGVYVRRCDIPARHRILLGGVRVGSAEWTVVELAETLALVDLVVVIDHALHQGHTTFDALSAALVPRRRGVRTLRRALRIADGRSESRWETVLRLVHTLSGVAEVHPQYLCHDFAGRVIARADLRLGTTRRLAEYDGADHRQKGQHQEDLRREKALSRSGWDRYGYTAVEIHQRPEQIIVDAETAMGLEHDAGRVEGWRAEYGLSSLSDLGRWSLSKRMQRFVRDTSPRASRRDLSDEARTEPPRDPPVAQPGA